MFTKILIVVVLFLIVASLATALFYLLKDRNRSPRTVKALTARIGMSLALFFLLLMGYQAGVLHPHGLQGTPAAAKANPAASAETAAPKPGATER